MSGGALWYAVHVDSRRDSEQLRYPIPRAAAERVEREKRLFTLIRYTDALSRRERWTCIDWIGPRLRLRTQNYDDREL